MYWKKAHRSNKFVFTISSIWIIKTWNKSGYKYGNKYKVEKMWILEIKVKSAEPHKTLMYPLILC